MICSFTIGLARIPEQVFLLPLAPYKLMKHGHGMPEPGFDGIRVMIGTDGSPESMIKGRLMKLRGLLQEKSIDLWQKIFQLMILQKYL